MKLLNWMFSDQPEVDHLRHLVADLTESNNRLRVHIGELKSVMKACALDAAELAELLKREGFDGHVR
jgi:hypothetical protein